MSFTQLFQFGAPVIQNRYKELCSEMGISFDSFQEKLIEDTDLSYGDLKNYWTEGKEVELDPETEDELYYVEKQGRLIIHFDIKKKEILGLASDTFECLTDRFNVYLENL